MSNHQHREHKRGAEEFTRPLAQVIDKRQKVLHLNVTFLPLLLLPPQRRRFRTGREPGCLFGTIPTLATSKHMALVGANNYNYSPLPDGLF
jgi:hypothetical protein